VRVVYFAVIAGMLAYVSAHRERSHERLAKLAQWPAYKGPEDFSGGVASTLAHAAHVLGAPRVIAVWEEAGGSGAKLASWDQGQYAEDGEPGVLADLVATALRTSAFSSYNVSSDVVVL